MKTVTTNADQFQPLSHFHLPHTFNTFYLPYQKKIFFFLIHLLKNGGGRRGVLLKLHMNINVVVLSNAGTTPTVYVLTLSLPSMLWGCIGSLDMLR
jgi:hypothetical protein